MFAEDRPGPSLDHNSRAFMANPSVVFPSGELADNATTSVPSGEGCLDKSSVGNDTSVAFETNVNGLQGIRRRLLDCQISSNITDVIINSWRPGTQKQYSVYVNRWTQFCDERQINSISPSVTHVLEFLQMLYERDLSYSTINTARAALNCYLLDHKLHNTPSTLSTHPFVNRYMKGVFNSRTPTPKYSDTWDVKIVLDFIKNWHPLTDLALKHVTYKLVMLLALTTGQRCQTLASLDTQTMTKTAEQFVFRLTDHMKQNRPGHVLSTVHVRRYHQADLCVYQTLEHYLARTSTLRSSSKLFVSVVKPHGAVTTSTVSRWIKTLLSLSGIDTTKFQAHSTRVAVASKASASLPTDVILKHVGWASDCVFRKYYDKPIRQDDLFASTVLQ